MARYDPTKNTFTHGNLNEPLSVISRAANLLVLVPSSEVEDPDTVAQVYDLSAGALLPEIKPLAIWLKWLYYVDDVNPPRPWTPDEERLQVESYKAEERARAAARAGE
jgi:hypothetical protein